MNDLTGKLALVTGAAGAGTAEIGGDGRSELQEPATDGLVEDVQAPLGEHLLNIAVTQSEPGVQPDRMADDIGWEAVTLKGELAQRASLISISLSGQPSLCDNAAWRLAATARAHRQAEAHDQRREDTNLQAGHRRRAFSPSCVTARKLRPPHFPPPKYLGAQGSTKSRAKQTLPLEDRLSGLTNKAMQSDQMAKYRDVRPFLQESAELTLRHAPFVIDPQPA